MSNPPGHTSEAPICYVRVDGSDPLGHLSVELVKRGIAAGKVPADAVVLAEGGQSWVPMASVPSPIPARGVTCMMSDPRAANNSKTLHSRPFAILILDLSWIQRRIDYKFVIAAARRVSNKFLRAPT